MALTPGKILASSQRNIFQSVFIKLEKPKPPEKPCSFDCYPDNAKMELYLEKASTCWIGKQVFPSLTIIEIAHTDNKKECVIACLADRNCAVASYDAQKKLCTRRNITTNCTTCILNTHNYFTVCPRSTYSKIREKEAH